MRYWLILALGIMFLGQESHASPKQFTLGIITQRSANDEFWGVVEDLMDEACKDLGMKLIRYHAEYDRSRMVSFVEQAKKEGVDVLVFPNMKNAAHEMIPKGEELRMPMFLFNADLASKHRSRKEFLKPREHYKYWLGRMMPDDEGAGYRLAQSLIQKARNKGLAGADGKIHMVGITGTQAETPSIDRASGLSRAVREHDDVVLHQLVYGFWKKEKAAFQAEQLLHRYPDTRLIWTASDLMAMGVAEKLQELSMEPDKEVFTGGIDWALPGVEGLKDNKLSFSYGGHILEGAWIAVLLYDYLHGKDFTDVGVEYKTTFQNFDVQHTDQYLRSLLLGRWDYIDFRKFSRVLNPELKSYQFDNRILFQNPPVGTLENQPAVSKVGPF